MRQLIKKNDKTNDRIFFFDCKILIILLQIPFKEL